MEQNITASNSENFERLITNIIAHVKEYPPYTDEEYPPDIWDGGTRGLDINRIQSTEYIRILKNNLIAQVKKYPPYTDEEYPPDYADGSRGLDINRIQSTDYIRILKKHNDDFENILNEVLK